ITLRELKLEGPLFLVSSKKNTASPTPGVTPGCSSKRTKLSSFVASPTSSTKPPSRPPPLPPPKDERGVSLKFSRSYSTCLHTHQSLDQESGSNTPLVSELMRWAVSVCEELFSHPPTSQNNAQKRKLEEKVEYLGVENTKRQEDKKEVVARYQQLENDLRKL
ncbi:UNVERIFIED_CONTAM: hypothetical protein Sindi_0839100, partial [Sesamum indicum]